MQEKQKDTRRQYTIEERAAAVVLAARKGVNAAARELGIPQTNVSKWQASATPNPSGERIALWTTWHGSFVRFCKHANEDWRLPFGRTEIASILAGYGVRFAKRRSGRWPDEDALRGEFLTYFPNAQ